MHAKAKVVIIGGGFGGLFTALELASELDVTLITEEDHFLFTPMLYEYFSGEVEEWHIAPRYSELLDDDVQVIRDIVVDADLQSKEVHLSKRSEPLKYDILVLAVGGVTNYAGVPGAEQFSIPFRKIRHADELRLRMNNALDRVAPDLPPQDTRRALTFAVVGAGASGVELSTKMSDLLHDAFRRRALPGDARVIVIEMGDKVVPGMGPEIREFVTDALRQAQVEVHTLTSVLRVTEKSLISEHEGTTTELETAAVVWVGGVRVNPLIEKMAIEKTKRGLILVEPTLQLNNQERVFALGDIAFFPNIAPTLAGTAQLAFQQAGLAARNVRAILAGEKLQTQKFEELGEAVSLGTAAPQCWLEERPLVDHWPGRLASHCTLRVCQRGIIVCVSGPAGFSKAQTRDHYCRRA